MYMCICIFYHFSFLFRRVSWTYRAVGLAVARVASVQPGAAARASPGALTASLALTRLLQTLMMEPLGSALLQWGTHGSAREDRLEGHSVVSELGSAPLFKNTGTWGFAAVFSSHSVKGLGLSWRTGVGWKLCFVHCAVFFPEAWRSQARAT